MRKSALVIVMSLAALIGIAVVERSMAADTQMSMAPAHVALAPSAIQWGDAPPVLNKGAKMAVLEGDPGGNGMFIVRLRMPDGYKVAPHWHPMRENVTVISGVFHIAMGDKFDAGQGDALPAGGFTSMDAKMNHYAWTEGATEVEVSGMGPFQINYVDPKDDPSKNAM